MSETLDVTGEIAPSDAELRGPVDDTPAPRVEAPEPAAAAATEEAAPPEAAPRQADTRVPVAALIEERKRAQTERAERERLQAALDAQGKQFAELMATLKPPPAPAKVPNRDENPVEYLEHLNQTTAAELADLKAWREQRAQAETAQQREAEFMGRYRQAVSEFAQQTPDFGHAYEHVADSLARDYQEAGYSPAEATAEARRREAEIVSKAFRDGANPAERIYKLAKARGFSAVAPQRVAEQQIDTIERGQQAARSLGAAPSARGGDGPMTMERLAAMSEDEIAGLDPRKVTNTLRRG